MLGKLPGIQEVEELFDRPISVCIASATVQVTDLPIQERALVASAVTKRQLEFAAGRTAAREALRKLGCPDQPILRGHLGRPLWPNGYIGSITHCDRFCAAVVAREVDCTGVGFDAELPYAFNSALSALVYSEEEARDFPTCAGIGAELWCTLTFSAKEAFYKCYSPLVGEFLDFRDVALFFSVRDVNRGDFSVSILHHYKALASQSHRFTGRWRVHGELILTGCSFN